MPRSKINKGLKEAVAYAKGDKSKGRSTVYVMLAISERDGGGIRMRGMGDLADVYLSGASKAAVFRDLGPVLQKILHHNHGVNWVKDDESKPE